MIWILRVRECIQFVVLGLVLGELLAAVARHDTLNHIQLLGSVVEVIDVDALDVVVVGIHPDDMV